VDDGLHMLVVELSLKAFSQQQTVEMIQAASQ